jgi:hypothetical protein
MQKILDLTPNPSPFGGEGEELQIPLVFFLHEGEKFSLSLCSLISPYGRELREG